jgi:uncharacterized phage-associated protein
VPALPAKGAREPATCRASAKVLPCIGGLSPHGPLVLIAHYPSRSSRHPPGLRFFCARVDETEIGGTIAHSALRGCKSARLCLHKAGVLLDDGEANGMIAVRVGELALPCARAKRAGTSVTISSGSTTHSPCVRAATSYNVGGMSYEPRKAAQMIAYLILKSGEGKLNVLKAIKLVYLVDRESIKRFGFPVLDEKRCSMPHGPVNSMTYGYVAGDYDPDLTGWSEFLLDRENHNIALANDAIQADDLDELSDADIECADAVWEAFGRMNQWQLRDWTHNPHNVPEWEDPQGGSTVIPLQRILNAVGVPNAEKFAEASCTFNQIDRAFKSARTH